LPEIQGVLEKEKHLLKKIKMCETYLSSFLFIKTIAWEIKGGRQAEIPEIIVNLLDIMDSR